MAKKDPRYKVIKVLHEVGQIKTFKDIFKNIPKTVVATQLHINNNRFSEMIEDTGSFRLEEIKKMAGLFGIPFKELLFLVAGEAIEETPKRTRKA